MTIERKALSAANCTYPAVHILHPAFRYVPAAQTNIAETFRRIREQQTQAPNVVKINREKAAKVRG